MGNTSPASTESDAMVQPAESIEIVPGTSIFMRARKNELEKKLNAVGTGKTERQKTFNTIAILDRVIESLIRRNRHYSNSRKTELSSSFPSNIFRGEMQQQLENYWKGEFDPQAFDEAWEQAKSYCDTIATKLNRK
ncbi:MAG: hypothetical protein AAB706_02820 [Patescibacteria group bacterium]